MSEGPSFQPLDLVDMCQREILRENMTFAFGLRKAKDMSPRQVTKNQTECFLSVLLNSVGFGFGFFCWF